MPRPVLVSNQFRDWRHSQHIKGLLWFKSKVWFFVSAVPAFYLERHPHTNFFGFLRIDPFETGVHTCTFIKFYDS